MVWFWLLNDLCSLFTAGCFAGRSVSLLDRVPASSACSELVLLLFVVFHFTLVSSASFRRISVVASFFSARYPEVCWEIQSHLLLQFPRHGQEKCFVCSSWHGNLNQQTLSCFKVAQNSFQHFPRRRFWWVIITTLYQLMLQSWYQKTAQSLANTLVFFSWL